MRGTKNNTSEPQRRRALNRYERIRQLTGKPGPTKKQREARLRWNEAYRAKQWEAKIQKENAAL